MTSTVPPRLWLSPGEPAGIGPDLTLALASTPQPVALTVVADPELLRARARQLAYRVEILECDADGAPEPMRRDRLWVYPQPLRTAVHAGRLDPRNGDYVLDVLRCVAAACLQGRAEAMVTGPVHKAAIARAGHPFSGHTEFLAELCGVATPVMLLVADAQTGSTTSGGERGAPGAAPPLRVALATTHLPLRAVPEAITERRLEAVLRTLHRGLIERFGIAGPRILVCGLNPHAGEQGELGREEIEVLEPVLQRLRTEGLALTGPVAADTAFTADRLRTADAILAMYHDQGLPVLKHSSFGAAVNVTLGLPIIRTSVDHGTALELAGSGRADAGSLRAALRLAAQLAAAARAYAG